MESSLSEDRAELRSASGRPVIAVIWDQKTQDVAVQFDTDLVLNWEQVDALLVMARRKVDDILKMQAVQKMRVLQAAMQQEATILGQVQKNRRLQA